MTETLYLDTHALVWIITKQEQHIPPEVNDLINASPLKISPIVLLEFRYLVESKKYDGSQFEAIEELKSALGLEVCSEPFERVIKESLTLTWTRDPFDRIIVAQASLTKSRLLTKDRHILRHYPKAIWD